MSKETEQDNSWLIDLILSFFHSAEWKAPVLSFIEEKCIVFDDEEENKLEYTVIHSEFKKLAEGLIEAMLWELGATPEMFGEAFEKASNTPGYQKITKIIESIDNYEIFAKMMRKKNAALNEAAFKMLAKQEEEAFTKPTLTLTGEETKTVPTAGPTKTKKDRKTELQEKKNFGRLNTLEHEELTLLEKEQMKLIQDISMREEEDRKKIEEEEERILQQVLELSSREHEVELKKKENSMEEKEKMLKEKEEKLKKEEERIMREKEMLEKKKKDDRERAEREERERLERSKIVTPPVQTIAPVPILNPVKDKPKKKKKIISAEPTETTASNNSKTDDLTTKSTFPSFV